MHRRYAYLAFAVILLGSVIIWFTSVQRTSPRAETPETLHDSKQKDWQDRLLEQTNNQSSNRVRTQNIWPFTALHGRTRTVPISFRRTAIETLGGYQHLGLRFDRAYLLETPIGVGLWVVRGNGATCIFESKQGSASCAPDAVVERKGLELVIGRGKAAALNGLPDHFLAVGIAPNWASSVRLRVLGGRSMSVAVVENAYGLRARAPIDRQALVH